ncbi:hypothetical protein [Herbaspirillum robiniae]|uniref:Acid-shock protein n=1 Tax=Herbaspirillum robiniae TaxID=2014887 RepID=A0ABX2LP79_9BURK|nr:hypothetical protein [Herbaspirillum robiniae]NUU00365.1 hypothetical protein [Herbaspirillum robiniae]
MKTQAAKSVIAATLLTALALPVFAQTGAAAAATTPAAPAAATSDAAPKAKTSHAKHKAAKKTEKKAEKKDAAGADAKPATDAAKAK